MQMTVQPSSSQSPLTTYREFLNADQLAYQWDQVTSRAVFYPRVLGPGSGNTQLEWRISKGLGTVYSVTVISPKGEESYNVALIDMDEGFRLMSRVEGVPASEVRIGMRVRVRILPQSGEEPPCPVFDLVIS